MVALLTDQLRLMAGEFGPETAYEQVSSGEAMTFAEWESRSNRAARWLVAAGVAKGDRVALYLPPEEALTWMVAYAAVHKAGAVAVPTNTRFVARELAFVLAHAGVVAAVVGAAGQPTFEQAEPDLADLRVVVLTGGAGGPGPATGDGRSAPAGRPRHRWAELVVGGDDSEFQVPLSGPDIADILYTSGTTGRPKGVVVRHRNIAMVPNGRPAWSGAGWLHSSPLFTFAGISSVYNPMKLGMVGLFQPRFEAGEWLATVARRRPAAVFLVPAMAQLLLAHPAFAEADLSSIAVCSIGSAPLAPETLRRLRDRLPGVRVSNSWGMTEAGPAYCSLPPEEIDRRIGSVGRAVAPTEFRVVDGEGRSLPAGQVGELLVRNPGREREYFNDPQTTARTWQDGWLHSGDLAWLDDDGYLYIVGRQKEVIIRGGHNIHATDVEAALFEHPDVQEAAVAGVPHPVLGEDVAAWVVLRPGATVTADELRAFCAERLSDYKVPRQLTLLSELPRNPTGKVVKADLVAGPVAGDGGSA